MKTSYLFVLAAALSAFTPSAGAAADSERTSLGKVLVTYYWLTDESDPRYPKTDEVEIRDVRGKVIARTSRKFKRELALEGTGWLRKPDGRTLTYVRQVDGDARFRISKSPFGIGIGKCPLVPYRTIAVSRDFVKPGTELYIPAFKGAELPDGTIHDGLFIANDRAPFTGAHIDFFTGVGHRAARPFTRHGVRSLARVSVYIESSPQKRACHTK